MTDEINSKSLDGPVEIAPDTYWVGQREGVLLERNIYLRVFRGEDSAKSINMVVDPGPPVDLSTLERKVGEIIGDVRNIDMVFLDHHDPDVAYNAAYLQNIIPKLKVLCSEDSWRLARFYGLSADNYRSVDNFKNKTARLRTGHQLTFLPTPFCHFRGAVMMYDHETRILFTGDLFGGISYVGDLYADKSYWDGLKIFHQIYMPTREAIWSAVDKIRSLNPAPVFLAPQHGSIIGGEWVDYYLEKLAALPVGFDLLRERHKKENYIFAMNELLLELNPILGKEKIEAAMNIFKEDGSFPKVIHYESGSVKDIKVDLETAIDLWIEKFYESDYEKSDIVEAAIIKVLMGRNIPLPKRFVKPKGDCPDFFDVD